jgi:hypothetical protein
MSDKMKHCWGRVNYLDVEYEVELFVRIADRLLVTADWIDICSSLVHIAVTGDITGREERFPLVHNCLDQLCDQYQNDCGERPFRMLAAVLEKALNEAWGHALLLESVP